MAYLTMKQLLEAGVHFGHQTKRWNPKMKPYLFGARNGINIIDLQQTVKMFRTAHDVVKDCAANGGKVLFVGTKKQAQMAIKEESSRASMNYINHRWVGGLLTNFETVKKSISKLNKLEEQKATEEGYDAVTKKEALMMERQRERLSKNFEGVRTMKGAPQMIFVVDSKKETIGIKEARKLGIPVVAIVDSNCDPDEIDYIIPGNDDAIRGIKLFASSIADACIEGAAAYEAKLQAETDKAEASAEEEMLAAAAASEEAAPAVEAPAAPAEAPKEAAPKEAAPATEAPAEAKPAPAEPAKADAPKEESVDAPAEAPAAEVTEASKEAAPKEAPAAEVTEAPKEAAPKEAPASD